MNNIKETLIEDGVVYLPDLFDKNMVGQIDNEIVNFLKEIDLTQPNETDRYTVITPTNSKSWGYHALAGNPKPVIKVRGEHPWDDGMLDIFHIQKLIDMDDIIKSKELTNTFSDIKKSIRNINIYCNHSVTSTREYHRDSKGGGQFKAFIYLTDVVDESYGPYSYMKGTHTETTDEGEIVNYIADKGSLIISNQSGLHRGLPQQQGRSRRLISINLG